QVFTRLERISKPKLHCTGHFPFTKSGQHNHHTKTVEPIASEPLRKHIQSPRGESVNNLVLRACDPREGTLSQSLTFLPEDRKLGERDWQMSHKGIRIEIKIKLYNALLEIATLLTNTGTNPEQAVSTLFSNYPDFIEVRRAKLAVLSYIMPFLPPLEQRTNLSLILLVFSCQLIFTGGQHDTTANVFRRDPEEERKEEEEKEENKRKEEKKKEEKRKERKEERKRKRRKKRKEENKRKEEKKKEEKKEEKRKERKEERKRGKKRKEEEKERRERKKKKEEERRKRKKKEEKGRRKRKRKKKKEEEGREVYFLGL
ncbi:Hypothetical predicted protein, partial [Paramuricea clavata]